MAPPGGSYGGGMSLMEMVMALHANIYEFHYNAFGELDVSMYPASFSENADCFWDTGTYQEYLPQNVINNCNVTFHNEPEPGYELTTFIDGDGVIDHWDGIWLRDSGYTGYNCFTPQSGFNESCLG